MSGPLRGDFFLTHTVYCVGGDVKHCSLTHLTDKQLFTGLHAVTHSLDDCILRVRLCPLAGKDTLVSIKIALKTPLLSTSFMNVRTYECGIIVITEKQKQSFNMLRLLLLSLSFCYYAPVSL